MREVCVNKVKITIGYFYFIKSRNAKYCVISPCLHSALVTYIDLLFFYIDLLDSLHGIEKRGRVYKSLRPAIS